jgi:hypothetical protein
MRMLEPTTCTPEGEPAVGPTRHKRDETSLGC